MVGGSFEVLLLVKIIFLYSLLKVACFWGGLGSGAQLWVGKIFNPFAEVRKRFIFYHTENECPNSKMTSLFTIHWDPFLYWTNNVFATCVNLINQKRTIKKVWVSLKSTFRAKQRIFVALPRRLNAPLTAKKKMAITFFVIVYT